jgi:hypothetical protein
MLLAGCSDLGSGPSRSTRSFTLGFTDFPAAATQAAVDDAYRVIREDGDLSVYHYDGGVPWQEALAGTPYDASVTQHFAAQLAQKPPVHRLLLTTTPINFHRNGLALHLGAGSDEPLLPPFDSLTFGDSLVIRAFTAHCERLVQTFDPDYFGYAIEANLVASNAPAEWAGFLVLAESVYVTLKRNHPNLPVFATVQLEALYGDLPANGPAVQQLLQWSDVLAISTYPYTVVADPSLIPTDYFTGLRAIAGGRPVAIAETGWPAEPVTAPYPVDIPATAAWQAAYVRRLLGDMDQLNGPFVNWFFTRDYDDFWESDFKNSADAALVRLWKDDGLYAGDGTPRPALTEWRSVLHRPHFVAQRSSSSSRTDVSVRSSRYFTMTGAYSERPISRPGPELTGRLPGTTTAPAGISSGWSPTRR